MADDVLVQARIAPEIEERASAVLGSLGLTVSDALHLLLTRTAADGALPLGLDEPAPGHDAWFRAQVQEALDDPSPDLSNEEVAAYFAARRAALRRAGPDQA